MNQQNRNKILNKINDPADIRGLSINELTDLSTEIRELILTTVAKNGGHLAPNLGTVELTLALHYVFDTPNDKLIWDVGHQCYTHKIITGRRDSFATIRTKNGLSGFTNAQESPYDCFTTGHASNSISLALGLAAARDLSGEKHEIIAVIGDGALTGGMAFEALDHGGELKSKLIVVLNDNEMSISDNVGAISKHLMKLRANPAYGKAKRNILAKLNRIPNIGSHLANIFRKIKDTFKFIVVKDMFFEEMGFVYLGPIDGHNLPDIINILELAKTGDQPMIIHIHTQKGRGYLPAEQNPNRFHGIGAFDVISGCTKNPTAAKTYTDIFSETLIELANRDPDIVAITAAMADGTGLNHFAEAFPNRYYDVGIAEQHAVSFAAGLAKAGKKPVVAIYSTFLQRAYDQIIEDVCLQNLPVIFAIDRAGIVGEDGYSHQGIFDISYLRSIPNLTILAPKDGTELQTMLTAALSWHTPVAIRYPRTAATPCPTPVIPITYGKSEQITQGHDLAIIACGSMTQTALAATQTLKQRGITARLINTRFISPLDKDSLLQAATECHGRIVTIEENIKEGGFGEACMEALSANQVDIEIIALPQIFIHHGTREQLLAEYSLTETAIANRIIEKWFTEQTNERKNKA